jgi:hypothetical protein
MMLLEQQKNAPNWELGSKIRLSEFDLNTHRASSKHFQRVKFFFEYQAPNVYIGGF